MASVETNKQVYLFYQAFHQSNMDYMEAFKSDLKLSVSHNWSEGYYPDLATAALLEKQNITSDSKNEEKKIEDNIKVRDKYLTCLFPSGAYHLR